MPGSAFRVRSGYVPGKRASDLRTVKDAHGADTTTAERSRNTVRMELVPCLMHTKGEARDLRSCPRDLSVSPTQQAA